MHNFALLISISMKRNCKQAKAETALRDFLCPFIKFMSLTTLPFFFVLCLTNFKLQFITLFILSIFCWIQLSVSQRFFLIQSLRSCQFFFQSKKLETGKRLVESRTREEFCHRLSGNVHSQHLAVEHWRLFVGVSRLILISVERKSKSSTTFSDQSSAEYTEWK